jgi:hypothetical protein
VAKKSGQRVDWHYSGGRAHVLVLGDHAKALEVAKEMASDPEVHILRWFEHEGEGLYRDGVSALPEGAVGIDTSGLI